MKALNKICYILAIVFGLASLVLFFAPFAEIVTDGEVKTFVGAQLGFGSGELAKSSDILFCFLLTAVGFIMSIFSRKSKNLRYAAPGFGIVAAIYMLVIALSSEWKFVDKRPLPNVTSVTYSPFVILIAVALFLFTIAAVAYLLIDDYLEVLASKGEKLPILKRIVRFLRDYKSEYKKIVWPTFKDVVKNTVIVLIMCLLIGILIWGVDFGLSKLLQLILGAQTDEGQKMSETNEARWYVVHTYSGYENKVASDLATMVESRGMQELIQEIRIPTETVTEIKEDKKKEVERKIFPGYVLIKMIVTDDSWYVVRNIRGCTGFVGPASKPVPLTDEEVAALGVEKHSVEVGYNEGDNVKIISGPLEGYTGIVKTVDTANNNVCVVLSMFGRETPVELELDQIALADD